MAAVADALKWPKRTTSGSRLDTREVVVAGDMSKWRNEPPPARVWKRGRWWRWEACRNGEMNHLRLAFGCEGGGCGRHVETAKREVVVVGNMSKWRKKPPPARVWIRGRWLWWETCQNVEMDHLQLAFGCKGGGCNGRHVETAKWTTSGSRLDMREVVVVGGVSKRQKKNHLRLAFGCEGGGGGGSCVKTMKITTSGSHLDAREVVVGVVSKRQK